MTVTEIEIEVNHAGNLEKAKEFERKNYKFKNPQDPNYHTLEGIRSSIFDQRTDTTVEEEKTEQRKEELTVPMKITSEVEVEPLKSTEKSESDTQQTTKKKPKTQYIISNYCL